MIIKDIVEGHINEVSDKNSDISLIRMNTCKQCPLFKETVLGPICNNKLYMNSDGDVSTVEKPGYKKGCGCRLNAKTRLDRAICSHGRW